jgi:hypothetical protein
MPVTSFGGGDGSDWLQSLLAAYGAGQPYGPQGTPGGGVGPRGAYVPGGGVTGYQAATPGAPSMAMGQPGAQPPPMGMGGGPTPYGIAAQALPQQSAGNDGGFNNPYMAAAGANPPQGGPYVGSGPPGMTPPGPAPAGVGGPYVGGQGRTPYDPLSSIHAPATVMANAPPGQPSDTPTPSSRGGIGSDYVASRTPRTAAAAAKSNPRFGQVQYQVPGSGGPLSRNPIYSTLNLFGART